MSLRLVIVAALVILIAGTPDKIRIHEKIEQYLNRNVILLAFGACLLISAYDFIIGSLCAVYIGVVLLNRGANRLEHFEGESKSETDTIDENLTGFKNMISAATTVDQACKVADIYCKAPAPITPSPVTTSMPEVPTSPQFVDDKPVVMKDETMEAFDTTADFEEEDLNEGFVGKQVRELFSKEVNDGADFDMVGCRYDLKGNLNNEFLQGPPVALCDNYNQIEIDKIGGAFYPINP